MTFKYLRPCVFGLIAILLPVYLYIVHIQYFGFPDGHLTELERAQKILFQCFLWPDLAMGGYFFYLCYIASKRKMESKLFFAAIGYVCFIVILSCCNYILSTNLNHGIGG